MSIIEKGNLWAIKNPFKFIFIAIVIIGLSIKIGSKIGSTLRTDRANSNSSNSNIESLEVSKTECIGNQSCITEVRSNFTSTNKTILNESYEGDGKFKITALDPQRGVTFNATVKTDCNCTILDVQISDVE
jgi:uncharacterized protein (DUF2147 family)